MNQSRRTRDRNADLVLLAIFDFFFRKWRKTILLLLPLPLMLPPPKATTDDVDMTETPSKTKPAAAAAAAERTSASTAPPLGIRYFFIFFQLKWNVYSAILSQMSRRLKLTMKEFIGLILPICILKTCLPLTLIRIVDIVDVYLLTRIRKKTCFFTPLPFAKPAAGGRI